MVSGQPPYNVFHFQAESQKSSYNFQKIKVFKTNFGNVLKLTPLFIITLVNLLKIAEILSNGLTTLAESIYPKLNKFC